MEKQADRDGAERFGNLLDGYQCCGMGRCNRLRQTGKQGLERLLDEG